MSHRQWDPIPHAFNVPLAALTRWRIGGPADIVLTPRTVDEVAQARRLIRAWAVPSVIIGDGSNILFDDLGFRGVVLRMGRALNRLSIQGEVVETQAGVWAPTLVRATIQAGLDGLVHAIGIPGSVGGLVAMNGGSLRRAVGERLTGAEVMDECGNLARLGRAELDFGYRRSRLQSGGLLLVSATFQLVGAAAGPLRGEALAILAARRGKFPRNRANCGSVFISDPDVYSRLGPPGRMIEAVGLKGVRIGDAQISPDHANFIVNLGNARSADVLALIALARARVARTFGVWMTSEVRHLDPAGVLRPAHESFSE